MPTASYRVMLEMSHSMKELERCSELRQAAEAWGKCVKAATFNIAEIPATGNKDCNVSLYDGTTLLQRRIFKGAKP